MRIQCSDRLATHLPSCLDANEGYGFVKILTNAFADGHDVAPSEHKGVMVPYALQSNEYTKKRVLTSVLASLSVSQRVSSTADAAVMHSI